MSQKSPAPATISPLVAIAVQLRAEIATIAEELAAVEAQLIALGSGRYGDEAGNTCTVVPVSGGNEGAVTYALATDREKIARQIAGDDFAALFDRKVTYLPCAGFADVAPKLLTPARARDLVKLCEIPGKLTPVKKAHVRWH